MNRPSSRAVAEAFRRMARPLVWYYAITLVIPIANGAAKAGDTFVEHGLTVLILPPVLIFIVGCSRVAIGRGTGRR